MNTAPAATRRWPAVWGVRTAIAAAACLIGVLLLFWRPDAVLRVDEALRDAFVQASAADTPETRLTIVDIGEDALAEIGEWPWPRARLADLVETLFGDYGVRAVALDIVLPEAADAPGDARLASLATHAPLVLAQVFDYAPRSTPLAQGVLARARGTASPVEGVRAYGYIANHAGLATAPCVGNIGYTPDLDGVLRRIPLDTVYAGHRYAHLAPTLLACAVGGATANTSGRDASAGGEAVWRVPYRRTQTAYAVISASDVLRLRAPKALLEGRYVLVGSSALGLGDRVSTPLAALSAGVMVHAASLGGLLDIQEGKAHASWSARLPIALWTVASVLGAVLLIARRSAWTSILAVLLLVAVWLLLAFAGVRQQAEGSIVAPLAAYFVLLLLAIPHEWWRSQRSARRLLNTFSHYVARPVLNELLRAGDSYSLAPKLCEVTVLIADMEGYTRTTSSLSLEDAATVTKDFLDCLTRPVLERQGTLDKYTGDGLVAFWGAPLACADQADRAVEAALAIIEEVDRLNARRAPSGAPPLRVRIGIESGRALVGDLGTPFRSTYTAVGDCINFASRLERFARDLPAQVIIGAIANGMMTRHASLPLGRHALRGTDTVIELFTVKTDPPEDKA